MYEHAFHIDYGAAAAKYVDAFLRNIDWEVVDGRFRAAVERGDDPNRLYSERLGRNLMNGAIDI